MRERPDLAGGERSGNFAEQPFGKLGPTHRQLVHVDRKIGNVPAQWPRVKPAIFIKIALAELDKTTERLQQLEACFHGLAVQRIEHDIDPGAELPGYGPVAGLLAGLDRSGVRPVPGAVLTGAPS